MPNEFITDLFGDQEGIVYSPVKDKGWEQHFFEWPQEHSKLKSHIEDYNAREVYISPVLFKERLTDYTNGKPKDVTITPENFKGTNYLWTEFDGTTPTEIKDPPTLRVQSSTAGHEHWYWRLDQFTTDKVLIEDLTRRIAFHYGADLSAWDYQQVLRPVNTWNHKRNKPVTLLNRSDKVYSVNDFLWVPIPPAGTKVSISLGGLSSKDFILAKYKWKINGLDLLFKDEIATGKRSDALVALAYEAVEAGCSNEEAFVLLLDRDEVWGKFKGRSDRQRRLEGIIASVRKRKAINAEILQDAPEVYRFYDFVNTKINLQWAIEGLLPVAGSMIILGKAGIGKSTFSLRLAMDLALGRDRFLFWKIVNRQRVLFISLEMQHYELKEFFKDMQLPVDDQQRLQEEFYIWPIGNFYPLDTPDQQIELIKFIKMYKIDLIIIDSLSLSMYGSVSNDDDIKRLNSFLNEDVRKDLNCSYIFLHHPRKQSMENAGKELEQDDTFGSGYIVNNAQTVIILSQKRGSPKVHVKIAKSRMSIGMQDFDIERTPNRGFTLVGGNAPAIESGETTSNEERTTLSLGKLLNI